MCWSPSEERVMLTFGKGITTTNLNWALTPFVQRLRAAGFRQVDGFREPVTISTIPPKAKASILCVL